MNVKNTFDLLTKPRLVKLLVLAWLAEQKQYGSHAPPFDKPSVVRAGLLEQSDVDWAAARAWPCFERLALF